MSNVCGVSGWFISNWTLSKMSYKNKNSKTNENDQSQKQSKKLKKKTKQNSNNNQEKERLIRCWKCPSKAWNLYQKESEQKVSDSVCGNWAWLFQGFLTKATCNID